MEFYFYENWEVPILDIFQVFEKLEDDFLILNKSEKEYLQLLCIGSNYTVEIRELLNKQLIRHYRIGRKPAETVWAYLNSKTGLISLKKSEILSKDDTRKVLSCYLEGDKLGNAFYKRNISKEIGLIKP